MVEITNTFIRLIFWSCTPKNVTFLRFSGYNIFRLSSNNTMYIVHAKRSIMYSGKMKKFRFQIMAPFEIWLRLAPLQPDRGWFWE